MLENDQLHILEEAARQAMERHGAMPQIIVVGSAGSGKTALLRAVFGSVASAGSFASNAHDPVRVGEPAWLELVDCQGFGTDSCSVKQAVDFASRSQGHLVLHIVNGASAITERDSAFRRAIKRRWRGRYLVVINKADAMETELRDYFADGVRKGIECDACMCVSAKTGENLPELIRCLAESLENAVHENIEMSRKVVEARRTRRVRTLVYSKASLCAAIGASPLPCSDMLLMLPLQIAMVVGIGHIHGVPVTKEQALELLRTLGSTVGAGVSLRYLARKLTRAVPGGVPLNASVAFAGTVALGEAAHCWFRQRGDNYSSIDQTLHA